MSQPEPDMRFAGFDWDEGNRLKCQRHGLTVAEIESVFDGEVTIIQDPGHSDLEERRCAIGRTGSGRHAFVVFTLRVGRLRPISARFMHQREVARYEKDNP